MTIDHVKALIAAGACVLGIYAFGAGVLVPIAGGFGLGYKLRDVS